ncbi:hypothetical protein TNCV_3912991 [Trichonephila clavipes]|nr:hypothetical protein TNCV_3912991 [Trichonephila clavipes]
MILDFQEAGVIKIIHMQKLHPLMSSETFPDTEVCCKKLSQAASDLFCSGLKSWSEVCLRRWSSGSRGVLRARDASGRLTLFLLVESEFDRGIVNFEGVDDLKN